GGSRGAGRVRPPSLRHRRDRDEQPPRLPGDRACLQRAVRTDRAARAAAGGRIATARPGVRGTPRWKGGHMTVAPVRTSVLARFYSVEADLDGSVSLRLAEEPIDDVSIVDGRLVGPEVVVDTRAVLVGVDP